jgi:hypothetical protein
LGGAHQTIAPLQGRGLLSTSKLVSKYLDHLESWADNNAILERMTAIENMGDKATVLQYINKLDSEFCAARLMAEHKISKARAPWLAKLHQAYLRKHFWFWASRKGCLSQACLKLAEAIEWEEFPFCQDHLLMRNNCKKAVQFLQKCRWHSEKLRWEFLTGYLEQAKTQREVDLFQGLLNKREGKESYTKLKAA